jgi:ABC-type uncharacterized transport system permease subunit
MGALGAGIATGTSWLVYAVLKQVALRVATRVRAFDRQYADPYLMIGLAIVGLAVLRLGMPDAEWVLLPVVAIVIGAVFLRARATLSVTETFPELRRVPLLRTLLG